MSDLPVFGSGIWHFATYVDRYATEGYDEPVGLLEQIDRAGAIGDLSVVDLDRPFAGFDGTLDDAKATLIRNNLRAVAITPEIYNKDFIKGSITNPDPAVRANAIALLHEATELALELECDDVKLWFGRGGGESVWQLDQFPFGEDSVQAAKQAITFLKAVHRALDALDEDALAQAQVNQDVLAANKLVQKVLLSSMIDIDA